MDEAATAAADGERPPAQDEEATPADETQPSIQQPDPTMPQQTGVLSNHLWLSAIHSGCVVINLTKQNGFIFSSSIETVTEGGQPIKGVEIDPDPEAGRNERKQERVRHYDREEIRKYMQKQRKDRKDKLASPPKGYVCHHSRHSPSRRAELGLPPKPMMPKRTKPLASLGVLGRTHTVLRDGDEDENWGPYEAPNFIEALATGLADETLSPPTAKPRQQKGPKASREKSIQTEAAAATYQIDEATQVSQGRRDDSDDWLHALPSARVDGSLFHPTDPVAEAEEKLSDDTVSSSSTLNLPLRRPNFLQQERPVVTGKPPQPVANLLRQIEDLEHYIGNILEAPPFQALTHPIALAVPVQHPAIRSQPQPIQQPPELIVRSRQPVPAAPVLHSTPYVPKEGKLHTPPHPEPARSQRLVSQPPLVSPLDASTSTEYHQLPDRFSEFIRLSKRATAPQSTKPQRRQQQQPEPVFPPPGSSKSQATDLKSLFRMTNNASGTADRSRSRYHQEESGLSSFLQLPPAKIKPPAAVQQSAPEEPQQTYFRDFNEILRLDPNQLTEPSNSWKRVPRSQSVPQLPPSAPYNILAAISDELARAQHDIDRIPTRFAGNNSSDSDFPSHLSVSDVSAVADVADAATGTRKIKDAGQPPKNGSGSRTGHDGQPAGSRLTAARAEPNQQRDQTHPAQLGNPLELDTTYLTLTPQYTSFDTTARSAGVHPNSSEVEDAERNKDTSIFSARFSPIPRAMSTISVASDDSRAERKQSTSSSSGHSEHDRSIGERILEENASRITKTPSPRAIQLPAAATTATATGRSPDDLLSRLRAEMLRDESLVRSLQHVDRLEDSAREHEKRFRIQFDPQARSFFESQTEALRAIAQEVRNGQVTSNSAAYLQGSQAAMEVDRIQSRSSRTETSKQDTYSANFEPPSGGSSQATESWATTEGTDQPAATGATKQPGEQRHPKRAAPKATGAANISDSESTVLSSDASVLPPKAVDILLQEEAKQQRLLLKLREKAQVEKTLAELELLQMQKRILRAQGEREKAASIKKKQRGLLLKLQEERTRIEALRKQHKKDEQRSKGQASADHLYDSTFWETDWSTASTSTASAPASSAAAAAAAAPADTSAASAMEASAVADQADDESSTSTLQPISENIQVRLSFSFSMPTSR